MPILDRFCTIWGHGGLAPSDHQPGKALLWIDNAGSSQVPPMLAAYGFNPLPAFNDWQSYSFGSLLVSDVFEMKAGETLALTLKMFRAAFGMFNDVGFALLLQNGVTKAVLFARRPDGINHINDFGAVPGSVLPDPSPGVSLNVVPGGPVNIELGGIQYGHTTNPSDCQGTCSSEIEISYAPGAGSYQLLLGMFNIASPVFPNKPSALALSSVEVAKLTAPKNLSAVTV